MKTIFIVKTTYFKKNYEIDFVEEINRIFNNEDDAKGYCNLMNKGGNDWFYSYEEYEISTKDYKRYA